MIAVVYVCEETMIYAGSLLVIFSNLLGLRAQLDFSRVVMRLSDGSGESSGGYGFLEVKDPKKESFVRICSNGWRRRHTKAACVRLGYAEGLSYHGRIAVRGDASLKGIMMHDILEKRFFKKICHKHVLVSCSRSPLYDFSSDMPWSFSAFPFEGGIVYVCRDERSDEVADLVCRYLGFDWGSDNPFSADAVLANNSLEFNCNEEENLEECESFKSDTERCPAVNFVCSRNMTFLYGDVNIRMEISPHCTSDSINIVKKLRTEETYRIRYTFESNLDQKLQHLHVKTVCNGEGEALEGDDLYSYSASLTNCSSFYVNLTLNSATGDCPKPEDYLIKITIDLLDMTIAGIARAEPFFETNPGLVAVTALVVLILFLLAAIFGDWKPTLPNMTKDNLPRVPPPSLADVTDKADVHNDFEASGLHVHIIK